MDGNKDKKLSYGRDKDSTVEHLVGGAGSGAGGLLPGAPQHPGNLLQHSYGDDSIGLPPKRQAVVDRLRRRIETYRRRQTECVPRFDQSLSGAYEAQNLETSALQKRYLEGKAKRQAKKSDRKPDLPAISGNLHSSVHVQQKFGCGDYEPPKLQCGGGVGGAGEALTKFSVEIVQQLEFTTSAADSQPQQISTNVTVKALANAVKSSNSPPPPPQPRAPTPLDCERECKAECKSEAADDEYVGLDECAAALERDGASAFPGFADLIGEDVGDEIKSFQDLIHEISEYPEFDFDLDGGKSVELEPPEGELAPRSYGGEMSPAAQTLKHMAEQHQQGGAGAGTEWARYRGGYGPYRAPRPPPDHLHLTQQQQMHLSQAHHNLQVSAAQHMQVTGGAGHVSVAAQQGMYFGHQGAPSPQHHQGSPCDSYSVSQSQSINFSPQMRPRQPAPAQPAPSAGPGGPPPLAGVAAAGMSREYQAKMLQQQQQQMLRAQHQQQMRPPPPEYKARFAGAPAPGPLGGARRPAAPGPPPAAGLPRGFPPHARAYSPEWRHVLMQHQAARHQFPHHHQVPAAGFMSSMGGGMAQHQLLQQQQARLQQQQQQQQLMQHQAQQRTQNQQSPMTHLLMQQNQMMNVQGQMNNIHMSQSQSMSMQHGMGGMGASHQGSTMQGQNGPMQGQNSHMQGQNSHMQGQTGPMHGGSLLAQSQASGAQHAAFPSLHPSSFSGAPADFNLDFLDNLPSSDASNLTAQELLNSLDNAFLNDIL